MRGRRSRTMWIGAAALMMVATLLPVAAVGATGSDDGGLFAPAASGRSFTAPAEVTRHRDVTVDVGSLFFPSGNAKGKAALGTVTLNLFDDAVYTGTVDRVFNEDIGDTWSGGLDGTESGYFHLAVADGTFAAHVNDGTRVFEVESDGGGGYRVIELDQSQFVDHPPGSFDDPIVGDPISEADLRDLGRGVDSGDVLDILVLYTPAAKAAEGGTAATEAMIALALAETNTSYNWSGTSPRLRLLHVEEVAYTEYDPPGTDNPFDAALDDLLAGTNGLGGVAGLRDTYGADMVGLIIDDPSYCGLAAGILPGAAWAYQVTDNDCATGYYSFGHEFGHLQGAHHDDYVAPGSSVWIEGVNYAYNNGWVNLANRWRTVMAYNSECADTSPFTYCTRLQYWSNPNKDYPDAADSAADPLGGPGAKNSKILNLSAVTVANWRKSRGADFDSQFTTKAKGWGPVIGNWGVNHKGWYWSKGKSGQVGSTYHAGKYGDITFEAMVKYAEVGCANCDYGLTIRGKRKNLTADADWRPSLQFLIANDGEFAVYRVKPNGNRIAVQSWTFDAAIKPGKWNKLKVVAVGDTFTFYVNNQMVWTGTATALAVGDVGLMFYRDSLATTHRFMVDWATLDTTAVADPAAADWVPIDAATTGEDNRG